MKRSVAALLLLPCSSARPEPAAPPLGPAPPASPVKTDPPEAHGSSQHPGPAYGLGWIGVLALMTACGGDDDGPSCPHDDTTVIELSAVSPALGATVTNDGIVHTFTTVGFSAYFAQLRLALLASHTAGAIPVETTLAVMPSGEDFVYTFMPLTWPTAPARVAFWDRGLYVNPEDRCRVALPNPLFEYDIVP